MQIQEAVFLAVDSHGEEYRIVASRNLPDGDPESFSAELYRWEYRYQHERRVSKVGHDSYELLDPDGAVREKLTSFDPRQPEL